MMAVFRSRGTMPVARDVLMMFVMVSKRMSTSFYKKAWWEWDQVHKTWQMHC